MTTKLDDRLVDVDKEKKHYKREKDFMGKTYKNIGEKLKHILISSVYATIITSLLFAISPKKISKLEQEIVDYGNAAQECLVEGDTTEAIINIIKGTNKARSAGKYSLFGKSILPEIEKICDTDFYDKKTGSVIYKGIEVDKPSGTIKYPLRYQHDYFPKETEKKD